MSTPSDTYDIGPPSDYVAGHIMIGTTLLVEATDVNGTLGESKSVVGGLIIHQTSTPGAAVPANSTIPYMSRPTMHLLSRITHGSNALGKL